MYWASSTAPGTALSRYNVSGADSHQAGGENRYPCGVPSQVAGKLDEENIIDGGQGHAGPGGNNGSQSYGPSELGHDYFLLNAASWAWISPKELSKA